MKVSCSLVQARFFERRKRFFADAILENGEKVVAHCPNPGSMRGNSEKNARIFLNDFGKNHLESGKKLRYRWDFIERVDPEQKKFLVCVNTGLSNRLVLEALQEKKIPEFAAYEEIIPEFSIGESRLDFLLQSSQSSSGIPCVLEVKSVSMIEGNIAYFPDSITTRGQKHILNLIELAQSGIRAVILFLIQSSRGYTFRPADFIDKEYGKLLRMAAEYGVEIYVYNMEIFLAATDAELRFGSRCSMDLTEQIL